jgi:hypothetical protein
MIIDGCPHCCKLHPVEMARRLRARVARGERLIPRLAEWLAKQP